MNGQTDCAETDLFMSTRAKEEMCLRNDNWSRLPVSRELLKLTN